MIDIKNLFSSLREIEQLRLAPHPRLFIGPDELERLNKPATGQMLMEAEECVRVHADVFAAGTAIEIDENHHNSTLLRAQFMQTRIFTLLVRYFQTGDNKYRSAVLKSIQALGEWKNWSWWEWRAKGASDWELTRITIDLSFGENSATIAVAYDLLYGTLLPEERKVFIDAIKAHRIFYEFIESIKESENCSGWHWYQDEQGNWLTVLCGGIGMLALAFYEELPEAKAALFCSDKGVSSLMQHLALTGGGWPEGLAYLQYTLRYAVPYMVSYERATGSAHESLVLGGARKALGFFLDMQPNGVACLFGDANAPWRPMGFYYMLTEYYGLDALAKAVDASYLPGTLLQPIVGGWPIAAELLLFRNRTEAGNAEPSAQHAIVKTYPVVEYGIMADRLPNPGFYLSVRGGNSLGEHDHNDLTSFHCVVGDENMLVSLTTDEYLDTTFSSRRMELFEITPASKNVLLINGVGTSVKSRVNLSIIQCESYKGLHIDATEAMGKTFMNENAADFYARVFLMLDEQVFLIVDRALLPHPGRVEVRLHTYASIETSDRSAVLTGQRHKLRVAFASTMESLLMTGVDVPTTPKVSSNVIRYANRKLESGAAFATLLTTADDGEVIISEACKALTIKVYAGGKEFFVYLTPELYPTE